MIIEIKDLPSGRKVSRILVDVTFEDSSELVEQEIFSSDVSMKSPIKTSESAAESLVEKGSDTISVASRAPVDIPDEMLNMEF